MILAVIEAVPSMRSEDVLAMDALLAIALLGAKARCSRRSSAQHSAISNQQSSSGWVTHADGRRERRITSMDDLSAFLKGRLS